MVLFVTLDKLLCWCVTKIQVTDECKRNGNRKCQIQEETNKSLFKEALPLPSFTNNNFSGYVKLEEGDK